MKKTVIIVVLLTTLSKMLGFIREMVLAYFYGTSNISDAYLISMTIPQVIFSFIGVSITTGYIPMYINIEKEQSESKSNHFTNNLINIIVVTLTLIIFIGLIFTEYIIKAFAAGFQGETLAMAMSFTRISLFGVYFTATVQIYNGFLQLKNNFVAPAMVGFISNVFIIAAIFISTITYPIVLAIGSVISIASQLIFLVYFVRKKGIRYQWVINLKDKYIISMAKMSLPLIIGLSVNQLNVLINNTIASWIAIGGISALYYADRLNSFVLSTVVMSISVSVFPLISKMVANNNMIEVKKIVSKSINAISLIIIPATIGTMVFARPVTNIAFGRGAFDTNALFMTSNALFFYSLGMIGVGLREIISRVFYSLQDSKTPMLNALLSIAVNISLSIILSRFMGIAGLALATSISAMLCTGLLFISLRKKIGPFGMRRISISCFKILIASLIMGVIAKILFTSLSVMISPNLSFFVSVATGLIIYFSIIFFMKIEEFAVIINAIKKYVGRF